MIVEPETGTGHMGDIHSMIAVLQKGGEEKDPWTDHPLMIAVLLMAEVEAERDLSTLMIVVLQMEEGETDHPLTIEDCQTGEVEKGQWKDLLLMIVVFQEMGHHLMTEIDQEVDRHKKAARGRGMSHRSSAKAPVIDRRGDMEGNVTLLVVIFIERTATGEEWVNHKTIAAVRKVLPAEQTDLETSLRLLTIEIYHMTALPRKLMILIAHGGRHLSKIVADMVLAILLRKINSEENRLVDQTAIRPTHQMRLHASVKLRAVQIETTRAADGKNPAAAETLIGGARKTGRDVTGVEAVTVMRNLEGKTVTETNAGAMKEIRTTTALRTVRKVKGDVRIATATTTTGNKAADNTEIDIAGVIRMVSR